MVYRRTLVSALFVALFFSSNAFASGYVQIFQGDLLNALRSEKAELEKVDPALARRITKRRPVSRDAAEDGEAATYASLPSKQDLAVLPLPTTAEAEFVCMTEALYFEARGESVKGIFAVAEVIMNRAKSTQFPNSVCGVINQGAHRKNACQFSYKCDGIADRIHERDAFEQVSKIAELAMQGAVPKVTEGALYYHTNAVRPRWSRVFERTASIGVHYFYRPGS
ncbi:MAG: cell wall hydrolase [Pseudomonadota bacterium]